MDGIRSLREAINTIPIPGAPPRLSRTGAAIGLAFLDAVLRLNHVRRLTERLDVTEHRAAQRTTEIDISLPMLDSLQIEAGKALQDLARQGGGTPIGFDTNGTTSRTLWVPVAQISRQSVAPVDVRDGGGQRLPRLTQHETSKLLASGLNRLMRAILTSRESAGVSGTPLHRFLYKVDEPRWLMQYAIQSLLAERNKPETNTTLPTANGTRPGHGRKCRDDALAILDIFEADEQLGAYRELLDLAVNNYLLVVGLDQSIDDHVLTYETPLHIEPSQSNTMELWRRLTSSRTAYYIDYRTSIPSTLRSYHLVVQTTPGVEISRMYLSTDADSDASSAIAADLRTIAEFCDSHESDRSNDGASKALELLAQTVVRRLAELMRRRTWEASSAGLELRPQTAPACHELFAAATLGEATEVARAKLDNSLLHHPSFTGDNLKQAAGEIEQLQLGRSLSIENDPAVNRAHAYWRRQPGRLVRTPRIAVGSGIVLQDTSGSGPRSVILYALAVAGIIYALASLIARSPVPYSSGAQASFSVLLNVEAIIAVLLLVPGFLYTRLSLPSRHTISGYLRTLPRLAAQICIISSAGLAAMLAAGQQGQILQLAFFVATVLPLLAIALLIRWRFPRRLRWRRGAEALVDDLARTDSPKWTRRRDPKKWITLRGPNVVYSSARSHS